MTLKYTFSGCTGLKINMMRQDDLKGLPQMKSSINALKFHAGAQHVLGNCDKTST